jgi:hypothetical protein
MKTGSLRTASRFHAGTALQDRELRLAAGVAWICASVSEFCAGAAAGALRGVV